MERQRNPQKEKHRRDTEGDTSWEGEQEKRKREREGECRGGECIGTVGVKFRRAERYIYLNGEGNIRCFLYRNNLQLLEC